MSLMTTSEQFAHISDNELLEMLATLVDEDEEMAKAITVVNALPWDCIAPTEEINKHLYIIVDGLVQMLIRSKEDRRLATAVIGPGTIFGEEAILELEHPRLAYCAQAIKPSVLWKIPAETARACLLRHPALRLALLRTFGLRMVQVENRLEEVAYHWLPERLAAELIRQSRYTGSDQIRLSHQGLANSLGTYRETVSAILRDFREAGWVKLGYRRITILDREALKKMSGEVQE
ncbi:MAG TPA: Crp/Fnr family transcriptional regulator [Anaerolineae bacterium]|nr:Crp/Fnr family transcriptional regulator [Anaerolineae bacterium]